MKTVKQGSKIDRMTDEKALKAVDNGWAYCPKKEWKKVRDGNSQVVKKDETNENKTGKSSPKANKAKKYKKEKNIAQS